MWRRINSAGRRSSPVVALGFYLHRRVAASGEATSRLQGRTVWQTLNFIVTALVFLGIGVELGRLGAASFDTALLWQGALVSVTAIAVRLAWMLIVPAVIEKVRTLWPGTPPAIPNESEDPSRNAAGQFQTDARPPTAKERVVLGWAGMRGVVSLALALAIPLHTATGAPMPDRGHVVLLASAVIFVTLVGQGLTLAPLVHWLKIGDRDAMQRQRTATRRMAVAAAQQRVNTLPDTTVLPAAMCARLRGRLATDVGLAYDTRDANHATQGDAQAHEQGTGEGNGDSAFSAPGSGPDAAPSVPPAIRARVRRILEAALAAERETVDALRDAGRVGDETAQQLEAELEVDELRLPGTIRYVIAGGEAKTEV